jgi:HEAT repeat protein
MTKLTKNLFQLMFVGAFLAISESATQSQSRTTLVSGQQKGLVSPQKPAEVLKQKSLDELIAELREHPDALHIVRRLRQIGDKRALPVMKEAFEKVQDKMVKQWIASDIVRLGEEDRLFFDYLLKSAKGAATSDMPYPLPFDKEGKPVRGQYSKEFIEWCEKHKTTPEETAHKALFLHPTDITVLAVTGDRRGASVFLQGLESSNYLVAARSAQGLARIQEKSSIRSIIRVAKHAPPEAQEVIARALIFFDDSEAQAAADELIKRDELRTLLRQQAKEKGYKAIFGEE